MKRIYFLLFVIIIIAIFFYPIFQGKIPFPGDALISGHQPYKTYSFLGYAPGGVPNKAQGSDVIRMLYPFKWLTIEQLKQFHIPLWNPYTLSGNVHAANLQSVVYYPLNLFFLTMPFSVAWTLLIVLQPFLAILFLYLYLREIGLQKNAALFGGIVFAFSAFMTVWLQYGNLGHTMLWLPCILYLLERYKKRPSFSVLLLLSVSIALTIFAGYIQLAIYIFLVTGAYILFKQVIAEKWRDLTRLMSIAVAFFLGLFLTAIQLLPLAEVFLQSSRYAYSYSQIAERLIPFENLVTLVIPDFFGNPAVRNYWLTGTYIERAAYIGIVPLLFAFYAVLRRRDAITKFFLATGVIAYVSTLQIPPIHALHGLGIPILSTTVPSRVLAIVCFSLAVLAAIGFDIWLKEKKLRYIFYPIPFICGLFGLLWLFVITQTDPNFLISKRNMFLPTGILIVASGLFLIQRFIPKKVIVLGLFFLTIADLFYFFHKITPFAPTAFLYPKTEVIEALKSRQELSRSWGYGAASIDANLQIVEGIYGTDGYDPLFSRRYAEFIAASKNGKIPDTINRSDVNLAPGFGDHDLRDNPYRQKMLNILGVKYILHTNTSIKPDYATFPQEIYKLAWQSNTLHLYENTHALKRAYLVGSYIVEPDKEKIIQTLLSNQFDIQNSAVLEENEAHIVNIASDPAAQVAITEYQPNRVSIETNTRENMLLVLTDTHFPGWTATVDAENAKIYRANYAFRGVFVPAGVHNVIFRYEPVSFAVGAGITIMTLIGIVLWIGKLAIFTHDKKT